MLKNIRLFFLFMLAGTVCLFATSSEDSSYTKVKLENIRSFDFDQDEINHPQSAVKYKKFALNQPTDKWFSKDKWMHLSSAYIITLHGAYTSNHFFLLEKQASRNISVGISIGLAMGKEFYDAYGKDTYFSWKDFLYDLAGSTLGYLTLIVCQ